MIHLTAMILQWMRRIKITASVSDSVGNTASVTYAFDVFNNADHRLVRLQRLMYCSHDEDDLTVGGELQTQFFQQRQRTSLQ